MREYVREYHHPRTLGYGRWRGNLFKYAIYNTIEKEIFLKSIGLLKNTVIYFVMLLGRGFMA